jgi:hypothetical protein
MIMAGPPLATMNGRCAINPPDIHGEYSITVLGRLTSWKRNAKTTPITLLQALALTSPGA